MTGSRRIDLIVIGCSAGGVQALKELLASLSASFRPAVAVVQHIHPDSSGILAQFFQQVCARPVKEAEDKEPIAEGTVYFAPANYHLLVERDRSFSLSVDPPVCFSRPSIDVLFESAADAYNEALASFVLTGANEDGAAGTLRAKSRGALTVVQDPSTAEQRTMPESAIAAAQPDLVMNLDQMKGLLREFI